MKRNVYAITAALMQQHGMALRDAFLAAWYGTQKISHVKFYRGFNLSDGKISAWVGKVKHVPVVTADEAARMRQKAARATRGR